MSQSSNLATSQTPKTHKSASYKIVASDLDGTLLLPDHSVGEFTKQTLRKLHQQGFVFAFATGRHHIDVNNIRAKVGIPAYMITSNGARVHTPDNELLYANDVDEDLVQPIVDLINKDPRHIVHIYRNDDWLTNKEDLTLSEHHKESGFQYQLFDKNNAPTKNIAKIFFTYPDHEHLAQYEQQLNEAFGDRVSVAFSTPFCLEVMALNVSKGNALKAVAETLSLSLENCLAFGDGMNDKEMLSMANLGLIMQSAHDRLKRELPNHTVIGHCKDEAVANYLSEHLLT